MTTVKAGTAHQFHKLVLHYDHCHASHQARGCQTATLGSQELAQSSGPSLLSSCRRLPSPTSHRSRPGLQVQVLAPGVAAPGVAVHGEKDQPETSRPKEQTLLEASESSPKLLPQVLATVRSPPSKSAHVHPDRLANFVTQGWAAATPAVIRSFGFRRSSLSNKSCASIDIPTCKPGSDSEGNTPPESNWYMTTPTAQMSDARLYSPFPHSGAR
mmetsp:Transcript_50838/g.135707  ORF Transcript_50838/g.135707 Transcript_50838/m.135707 type:complete len:214 (-) Transcript_50838:822-1463(-)